MGKSRRVFTAGQLEGQRNKRPVCHQVGSADASSEPESRSYLPNLRRTLAPQPIFSDDFHAPSRLSFTIPASPSHDFNAT